MNLSLSKDVKTNWKQLKDLILKVGYQYFSACIDGFICLVFYAMLGSVKNARLISNVQA